MMARIIKKGPKDFVDRAMIGCAVKIPLFCRVSKGPTCQRLRLHQNPSSQSPMETESVLRTQMRPEQ